MSVRSVLLVRSAFGEIYELAWLRAFSELGIPCRLFDAHSYASPSVLGRLEKRCLRGPLIARANAAIETTVRDQKPDVTLFYHGHHFHAGTIARVRNLTFAVGIHMDDPFGLHRSEPCYRLLVKAMPHYHGFHFCRQCTVDDALRVGVPRAKVLMQYYLPWKDFPHSFVGEEFRQWQCDVVFAGHGEPDNRVECLAGLVREGFDLRLYGDDHSFRRVLPREVYQRFAPIHNVRGDDYRKALCGAKIAACFFSKWNRDEYTLRSFEIPACGVFMLAERTAGMQQLFEEGKEAEFFDSVEEFISKIRFYLQNDSARQRVAAAGHERVVRSGHDIVSRARQWLRDIEEWRNDSGSTTGRND